MKSDTEIKKATLNIDTQKFLLKISDMNVESVFKELKTNREGLTHQSVLRRTAKYGKNTIAREKPPAWYLMILANFKNPFVLVLILLGTVSYVTNDTKGTIVVSIMVTISVLMRFMQEYKSSRAAEALRAMVRVFTTVKRIPTDEESKKKNGKKDIPLEELVPGDIVFLSAGDMIPADVRLISSKDLFISQSALTGESVPVEKHSLSSPLIEKSTEASPQNLNPLERNNLCFMGTSVVSGLGEAVVVATGPRTLFGSLSKSILGYRSETSFDMGINKVTWILIRVILVMVPIIFVVNGVMKEDWKNSFLFAIAVAVGLTPELLPMIVTANLARGAVAMSRFKVIVKRLNSIQNLGAMDILCTDKTGTLTQDKIILEKYLNVSGEDSPPVLEFGFLNSYFQTGLKNMLDKAIIDRAEVEQKQAIYKNYQKIDEIPFDFSRKRLSVIVQKSNEPHLLICKGSVDETLKVCTQIEIQGNIVEKTAVHIDSITKIFNELSDEGFRVIALAYKKISVTNKPYSLEDENHLVLLGLMAFLDPPKETVKEAINNLKYYGVKVKVLTGDNDAVTKHVCKIVDLPIENSVSGPEIEQMTDKDLSEKVKHTTVFARLTPLQKSRIIKTLQNNGHVVGFLGDGINDAAGLRTADVGISVDTATDIARESADIILLEKSLLVLGEGVVRGRKVYGNIIKYIKMTTSSNFGNVLSVLIASLFLPFLPMLPLQILVQNLLYDFSQLTIPWDRMDPEFLKKTRTWDPKGILRFMLFIGPISSIFDIATFLILWYGYHANSIAHGALFQSGWFIEGLLSQTLIVHMIRTQKIPFFQSTATTPVILMTVAVMAIGLYLPFSFLGEAIELTPLPGSYFIWLGFIFLSYCIMVQLVKMWYIKRFKAWL